MPQGNVQAAKGIRWDVAMTLPEAAARGSPCGTTSQARHEHGGRSVWQCVTSSMCVVRKSCLFLGQLIALQTIVFLESVVTCLTHLTSKISILPEAHDKAGVLMRVTQGLACPAGATHGAYPAKSQEKGEDRPRKRWASETSTPSNSRPARIGTKKRSRSIHGVWRWEIFDWICLHHFP